MHITILLLAPHEDKQEKIFIFVIKQLGHSEELVPIVLDLCTVVVIVVTVVATGVVVGARVVTSVVVTAATV